MSPARYNRWREALCRFALGCEPETVWANPEAFAGKPFFELIHFSDAEGCIGGRRRGLRPATCNGFTCPQLHDFHGFTVGLPPTK